MSRIGREITRAAREIESDLGLQTIQWNNGGVWGDYVCIPKSSVYDLALSMGGLQPGIDAVFLVARDKFGDNAPEPKQVIKSGGKTFWIHSVNLSADQTIMRLDCQLPEHRA